MLSLHLSVKEERKIFLKFYVFWGNEMLSVLLRKAIQTLLCFEIHSGVLSVFSGTVPQMEIRNWNGKKCLMFCIKSTLNIIEWHTLTFNVVAICFWKYKYHYHHSLPIPQITAVLILKQAYQIIVCLRVRHP